MYEFEACTPTTNTAVTELKFQHPKVRSHVLLLVVTHVVLTSHDTTHANASCMDMDMDEVSSSSETSHSCAVLC